MRNKIPKKLFFLISFLFFCGFIFCQNTKNEKKAYRRHFIIAYDISTPFKRSMRYTPEVKTFLENLFVDPLLIENSTGNIRALIDEQENNIAFFNPELDEISFFHFGVSRNEFNTCQQSESNNKNEEQILNTFLDVFLKDKGIYWSDHFKEDTSINNYFSNILTINSEPISFGRGVTLSYFVYPLLLEKLTHDKYAEEYILIILSDFQTGSHFGNKDDILRINEMYGYGTTYRIIENSAPYFIENRAEELAYNFYTIDYFDYSTTSKTNKRSIGVISKKIKPKVGKFKSEDITIFIDSDVNMKQVSYESNNFETSEIKVKFPHNKNLKLNEVILSVRLLNNGKTTEIFNNPIATIKNNRKWGSDYTGVFSGGLMKYDSDQLTYNIPEMTLEFDSLIRIQDFNYVTLAYQFSSQYGINSGNHINYVFTTERNVSIDGIHFYKSQKYFIIHYIMIPLIIILLIIAGIIVLFYLGKPKRIKLKIEPYLDSYEHIDYRKTGRLLTPYLYWNPEKNYEKDSILSYGECEFNSPKYLFNWNPVIKVHLEEKDQIPEGFDIYIKEDLDSPKEYYDQVLPLRIDKNNKFGFIVELVKRDQLRNVEKPELVKFKIKVYIRALRLFFIKANIDTVVEYEFHIGPDLKDVWVGFDAGTTGSCITAGNANDNIIIEKQDGEEIILPSKLTFDPSEELPKNYSLLNIRENYPFLFNLSSIYQSGQFANQNFGHKKFVKFQSIKKLLGYTDVLQIKFINNKIIEVNSEVLSTLLIKGVFDEFKNYIENDPVNYKEIIGNGAFNPLRVVVAIPNNFTSSKIQSLIDSLNNINQFDEIRYVYEAEAVLFNYINNYQKYNINNNTLESENVLVFDMGGATINATIVCAERINSSYDIEIKGKIGYGIGGDTIDYCIIKFLFEFKDNYPQLKGGNDPFIKLKNANEDEKNRLKDLRIKYQKIAFMIKTAIIKNYNNKEDKLLTAGELSAYINETLNSEISINESDPMFKKYFVRDKDNRYPIFEHPIFLKLIYENIADAAYEIIELCHNEDLDIDTIIFSGRSTSFPKIKDNVLKQLKNKAFKPKVVSLSMEESKTAVAKGACWYGINRGGIIRKNLKTNGTFGIKKSLSGTKEDIEFINLINMGEHFDETDEGTNYIQAYHEINDNFKFDGNKVNFYQVMGQDALKILSNNEKHKFSKIGSIRIPNETEIIKIKVSENDNIECTVRTINGRPLKVDGYVSDQEMADANEEHYTWIVI